MRVCFIGHRTIKKSEELFLLLKETIYSLIKQGATTFLFGSMSEFDDLSWEVVTDLKKEFPYIKRVYVRSSFQDISYSYEKYLHRFYEETYFPPKLAKAGKYSYVERNVEMINESSYCIFYYNEKHALSLTRKSGTKIALEYAKKKFKQIINVYKTEKN